MGFGDKIRDAINNATGANAIAKAMTPSDGHTTSGLDRAMQQHADQQHPVASPPPFPPKPKYNPNPP